MKMQWAILGTVVVLAACGNTREERASGGAAAGAATGAGIGAIAGPPGMAVGALVGAGAGAATGAATKPSELNLGKPPWTNPDTRVPSPNGTARPATTSGRSSTAQERAAVERLNDQSLQSAQSSAR